MKKLFLVNVYLNKQIHFQPLGFTTYAFAFAEGETPAEAEETVKQYFTTKHKAVVNSTRAMKADPKYIDPAEIVKPISKSPKRQTNIFEILNPMQ